MFTHAYDNPRVESLDYQSRNSFSLSIFSKVFKYWLQGPKSLDHVMFTHAYDNPKLESLESI